MPRFKLFTGNCFDHLPALPAACVDFVFADLPYGATQNEWDIQLPLDHFWRELHRVAKPNAALVFTARMPFTAELVCSNVKNFKYDLVWNKNKPTGFLNAKKQPLRTHENILVFYRSPPVYNPQKTLGHEPGHRATRGKKSLNYGAYESTDYGGATDRYPLSVLHIPIINNDDPDKTHPTQKPVDLVRYLIRTYTNPGAVVLDPTMGSGTTGVACMFENRDFIGMELKPEYVEIAQKRILQIQQK